MVSLTERFYRWDQYLLFKVWIIVKIHFHLVLKVADALDQIFSDGRYADKVLEKVFKQNRQLGARDRKFFAECVYEIVRHRRLYSEVMKSDDSIDLVVAHLIKSDGDIPKKDEFTDYDVEKIKNRFKYKFEDTVLYSFPDWLNNLGQKEFGLEWNALMKSLNQPALVYLRTNRLKTDKKTLILELDKEEIKSSALPDFDDAVVLSERKNVFTTNAFKKGFFEVQDASSQLIAPLLDVKPGDRVVDACAGAGGKSLHLASLMKNKGKIISMDIHQWKLDELKKRAARGGVDIIETKLIESTKTIKRFDGSFDRVLLDVPCSGLGVLRRNPDTKWKLSQEEIDRLIILQKEILQDYAKMCKPGGKMVYATCSILNTENENQVAYFLNSETGKNWTLIKEVRMWPHKDGHDGFFGALLQRKN